jgi:hypothetical protein
MTRPLAVFAALAAGVVLAGCGTAATPTPTPSSAAPTPTPSGSTIVVEPTPDPTVNPEALPGSAYLRVSATAEAAGERVRLQLTFSRATTAATAQRDFDALLQECPNAIESQLDIFVGYEPTGVITSRLEVDGDWPEGMRFAVSAGGTIASLGEGADILPSTDEPGMFGCSVPIVTGPGRATFSSLLLGDPNRADRADLDAALAQGLFGFEPDAGSAVPIRWRDCVIQLSSSAQRAATENAWVLPGEWGDGCLIGDGGTV